MSAGEGVGLLRGTYLLTDNFSEALGLVTACGNSRMCWVGDVRVVIMKLEADMVCVPMYGSEGVILGSLIYGGCLGVDGGVDGGSTYAARIEYRLSGCTSL